MERWVEGVRGRMQRTGGYRTRRTNGEEGCRRKTMQKVLLTLPKLGTYLVAALAGLDMNDLAHGCRVGGSSRVLGSVGVVAKSEQEEAAANLSKRD